MIFGGAGDDIITDEGGDDNLQGGDGNDAIQGGNGINLIIGGFGNDFIVTGEDESKSFGGSGNDFILGARSNEMVFGNEGDDWIERGMADGSAGENFDDRGLDAIVGNDVFMGDTVSDRMDRRRRRRHHGRQRRPGRPLPRRLPASTGPASSTIRSAANADLNLRAFDETPVPLSVASTLARFESMEGLSGSQFSDILRGDDADAATRSPRPAPPAACSPTSRSSTACRSSSTSSPAPPSTSFSSGNIILGGDGSDIIEGRGGDDLIDGDRWLNVRIACTPESRRQRAR